MKLRPFSSHERGLFVSVDGPSGAGKSTIVHHLAQLGFCRVQGSECRPMTDSSGMGANLSEELVAYYRQVLTRIGPRENIGCARSAASLGVLTGLTPTTG